jgi:hypothetical protein
MHETEERLHKQALFFLTGDLKEKVACYGLFLVKNQSPNKAGTLRILGLCGRNHHRRAPSCFLPLL